MTEYRDRIAMMGAEALLNEAKDASDPERVKALMNELAFRLKRALSVLGVG